MDNPGFLERRLKSKILIFTQDITYF